MMNKLYNAMASCFGIGYLSAAPGTLASIVTAIIIFFRPQHSVITEVVLVCGLICVSVLICHQADKHDASHDAGWIVLDEFVGMCVAVIGLPRVWWLYVVALCLFRFFDIVKPFPVSFFERQFSNGLGIVLDDVVAGLLTLGCMHLVHRALLYYHFLP